MKSVDPDIKKFLDATSWKTASRDPLAGDASSRRYERLTLEGQTAILMIDPSVETVGRFLSVTQLLTKRGYSVPAILAAEPNNGLLLLEDFGNNLFVDLIRQGSDEEDLYTLAVDFLIDLRNKALPTGLPYFSPSYVLDQNSMFLDWYIPDQRGRPVQNNARLFYQQIWRELLKLMKGVPEIMLLRDFHAENILYLENRNGVQALGLLDYQDAMTGPAAYDLVSLLQDARREVPITLEQKMIQYYLTQTGIEESGFRQSYAIMGAHRALRIMGIFTRLAERDGKTRYLDYMPRMKAHLIRNLAHPALIALKHWLEITLGKKF